MNLSTNLWRKTLVFIGSTIEDVIKKTRYKFAEIFLIINEEETLEGTILDAQLKRGRISSCNNGDRFFLNVFVAISKYVDKKIELTNIYKMEISSHLLPRSERKISAFAMDKRASSGCEYDESFMLIKEII